MRLSKERENDKLTAEQRAYNRIARKKSDKPYYKRYYTLYLMAIIFGWVANIISGITESSKIFSFFYGFLSPIQNGETFSWGAVIVSVILLELLHRLLSTSYFKDYVENDGHTEDMTWKAVAMLVVASFLTVLSFTGGFDLVRLTKEKPQEEIAEKIEVLDVEQAYSGLLSDLSSDISEYKSTRQWKGRLSDKSAGKWEEMKEKKQSIQAEMAGTLSNIPLANLEIQARTDSINYAKQLRYEREINDRGYGLGFLTIFAVLLLYGCNWYEQEYIERKASYLEKKFGKIENGKVLVSDVQATGITIQNNSPTPLVATQSIQDDKLTKLEKMLEQVATALNSATTSSNPMFKEQVNGQQKKT